jgi:hypothetical protein
MSQPTPVFLKDSPLYSKFLPPAVMEGEIREALRILIHEGTRRFGEPGPAVLAALDAVLDAERLEALCDQVVKSRAKKWDDLFRKWSPFVEEEPAPHPSSVVERVLREGRELGRFLVLRRALRRFGARRFGKPDSTTNYEISDLEPEDCDRLEALVERLFDPDLKTWDDLWRELRMSSRDT